VEKLNLNMKNLQISKDDEIANLLAQIEADRAKFSANINNLELQIKELKLTISQ